MTTRSYTDLPDEYFEQYFETYRELCSKTLRIWGTLYIGQFGQGIALSSLFDALTGRPLIGLVTALNRWADENFDMAQRKKESR
jgi:hypothetical protein